MKRILFALAFTLIPSLAYAQPHWGTFSDGGTLYFHTNTVGTDGVAETLASEAIAVYKDNSDTQLTTGAAIDDDVDATTGFHRISIDTTQSGFDAGSTYTVMYTAGTVDSVSVAGRIIGTFRLGTVPADTVSLSGSSTAADTVEEVFNNDGTGGDMDLTSLTINNASGPALSLVSSGGNGNGLLILGNGSGDGVSILGGATGNAMKLWGGATSGNGVHVVTTNGHAMQLAATGASKHGLLASGGNSGTSDGIKASAGTGGADIRGTLADGVSLAAGELRKLTGFKSIVWIDTTDDAEAVVEAQSAGTLCVLGPGTHAMGSDRMTIPDGVSVRGCGRDVTVLTSTYQNVASPQIIVRPGDNSLVEDMTIKSLATDFASGYDLVFGVNGTDSIENFVARRLRVIGLTDNLYFSTTGATSGELEDIIGETKWDNLVILNASGTTEITARRLDLTATEDTSATTGTYNIKVTGGTGSKLKLSDSDLRVIPAVDTVVAENCNVANGTVQFHNVRMSRTGTATSVNRTLDVTSGTAVCVDCEFNRAEDSGTITDIITTLGDGDRRKLSGFDEIVWVDTTDDAEAVIEAQSAGTLCVLSPGTHAMGSDALVIPDGVSVRGCGRDVTTVTSTRTGSGNIIVTPGDKTLIEDLTLQSLNSSFGTLDFPLGANDGGAGHFTGAVLRRARVIGYTDAIYFGGSGTSTLEMDDVILESKFDTVIVGASQITARRVRANIEMPSDPSGGSAVQTSAGSGWFKGFDCDFRVKAGAATSLLRGVYGPNIDLFDSRIVLVGTGSTTTYSVDGDTTTRLVDCEFDRSITNGSIVDKFSPLRPTVPGRSVDIEADGDVETVTDLVEDVGIGGPVEHLVANIDSNRVLTVKSRGDGTFGVVGRIRMVPGETRWWSINLAGTQLSAGDLVDAVSAPTMTGAQAANMTASDYGVYGTRVGAKLVLSGSAATSDTINVKFTITPSSGETLIVTVPVTVGE